MKSLRDAAIRLAAADPELRPHLLSILKEASDPAWFSGKGSEYTGWELHLEGIYPRRDGGCDVSGVVWWHRGKPDQERAGFDARLGPLGRSSRWLPWTNFRWMPNTRLPQGKFPTFLEGVVSFLTGRKGARERLEALIASKAPTPFVPLPKKTPWVLPDTGKAESTLEAVRTFLRRQRTWFDFDDDSTGTWDDAPRISMSTRAHGAVGSEAPGRADIEEARRLKGLVEREFGAKASALVDIVDEWVYVIVSVQG